MLHRLSVVVDTGRGHDGGQHSATMREAAVQAFDISECRAWPDGVLRPDVGMDALLSISKGSLCYIAGSTRWFGHVPQAAKSLSTLPQGLLERPA